MDQEILDRGLLSGAVLYNQGNAFMRAGQRGRAIAAYRQARRYLGPIRSWRPIWPTPWEISPARRRPLVEHLLFWQDWISYPAKFQLSGLWRRSHVPAGHGPVACPPAMAAEVDAVGNGGVAAA